MQTPEDDGHRRVDLVEAIAWWRVGGVDGRASLTRAASRALLGDADSPALAELAGVPADENPFVIDGLIERVVDELALRDELADDVELLAARGLCRALLAEKTTERELTRWVHQRFGHESTSELLNRLAELDDDFDVAGGGGKSGTAAIAERVRAVARRIVAGS